MEHAARSDAELVELAQDGSAPAFAVLLHRHGAAVREVVTDEADPTGAVVATYLTAMRHLGQRTPTTPVRPWLLELATDEARHPRPASDAPPALDADELDGIWAELDVRWPDGRTPRTVPAWLGWSALVVVLASLAVLVPYLILGFGVDVDEGPDELPSIVARPLPEPTDAAEQDVAAVEGPTEAVPDARSGLQRPQHTETEGNA